MKKFLSIVFRFGLPVLIVGLALFAAYAITTKAQINSSSTDNGASLNISFPVPELGNCTSKDDCQNYCNDPSHMDACIAFAKSHGLMTSEEVKQSQKFAEALQGGAGPGGCTTPESCQSYCSDIANLPACLSFAKSHGINNSDISQGEKIQAYLASGGKMPGGCTSKESCEAYCGDFSHAEECYNFAKSAGIEQGPSGNGPQEGQGGPNGGMPTPEQFQKLQQLAQSGQTPGGCTSKDSCESYCSNPDHQQECMDFAVKAGFMTPEEEAQAKAAGGKGPGGCDSKESCDAFCNDPANQQTCFDFGKEHGLISQDDLKNIQQGSLRMREGIDQAPDEVKSCIETSLGTSTIQDIQSGNFMPGPDTANQMKDCFEKFGHSMNANNPFQNAPQGVISCVKDKLGDAANDVISGKSMPTPEMADSLRVCFSQMQMFGGPQGQGGFNGSSTGGMMPPPGIQNFLQSAPPEIISCIKQQLGDDFATKIQNGGGLGPDVGEKIKTCMEQFRPQMPQGQMMNQENGQFGSSSFQGNPMIPGQNLNGQMPPYPGQGGMMGSGTQYYPSPEQQQQIQQQMINQPMPYNASGTYSEYPSPPSGTEYQFQPPPTNQSAPLPPPTTSPQSLGPSPFAFILQALLGIR